MSEALLKIDALTTGYDSTMVSKSVSLEVYPSELICILGPNGAGKSTLLKTIAKLLEPLSGDIHFCGKHIDLLDTKSLSQYLSIVLTDRITLEYMTVWEFVSLGRFPYTNFMGTLSQKDKDIVDQVIDQLAITHLQSRDLSALSDGQRQRVMIARALAQNTGLVILDEPTAFLDLPSKVELMALLSDLCSTKTSSFLVSTHDLDLALSQADRIWLIDSAGDLHDGAPEDLVLDGIFNTVFDSQQTYFDQDKAIFVNSKNDFASIQVKDSGLSRQWLIKALHRIGYKATDKDDTKACIEKIDSQWHLKIDGQALQFEKIYDLCKYLKLR
ncbi:MAG: ABC transporter ATP-binding protein [Candidatus Cloacimonetes bacterium]|nr:ABC transporter ATP-binding protein [Candidatus Cloacimonadota bacterium]